jgi:hypothetical protein
LTRRESIILAEKRYLVTVEFTHVATDVAKSASAQIGFSTGSLARSQSMLGRSTVRGLK